MPSSEPMRAHPSPGAARGLALRVEDLAYRIREGGSWRQILALPAFRVEPGEFVVLTGPSGSGKSTLLYLLSGLLRPTKGRVVWDGTDLARLGEGARDGWRRRNAGFVFQDFHLVEELSALDNVLVPAWFAAAFAGPLRARAAALLAGFGVPEAGRRAALLSRGEQQRTAMARALLLSPGVILADEPTASLDSATGAGVIAALAAEARDGRTVIAASHDPALIAAAGRRLVLARGRPVGTSA